jgi:AraC-like DNA-binding protein
VVETNPVASVHDATAAPPVAFNSWGDAVARSLLDFDFDFDNSDSFRGSVRNKPFAGIEFIDMSCDRHVAHRGAARIGAIDRPDYIMTLQLSGEFRMSQDGRTAVIKPGQFAFYDSTKPAELVSSDDYRSLCLKFPQRLLGAPSNSLRELTATRIDADAGLAPAVWAMLLKLNDTLESVTTANRYATVHGVMGLVGSMLQSQTGSTVPLRRVESRESLLERIHDYIAEHLGDPDLGPQELADAHFISLRYVHSLFQETGVSVSAWIRDKRLERCCRDLADPALANVPVAAIAGRRGFRGASHFGQMFKAATGQTPADFRRMSGEDG